MAEQGNRRNRNSTSFVPLKSLVNGICLSHYQ